MPDGIEKLSGQEEPEHGDIGQLMRQLVNAENLPEAIAIWRPAMPGNQVFFEPVDMIVQDEFGCDEKEKKRRSATGQEKRRDGSDSMKPGVQNAATMAIAPFVARLIACLKNKIEQTMFDLK